jgi:hypothetical protein
MEGDQIIEKGIATSRIQTMLARVPRKGDELKRHMGTGQHSLEKMVRIIIRKKGL